MHVDLYLSDCSKDLVEEKDNNKVEVVAHNTMESVNENVDANADDSDSDSVSDDDSGVEANSNLEKSSTRR